MEKRFVAIFIISAAFFLVTGCVQNAQCQNIENSVPTINVSGQGKITLKPDEAIARFGVENEDRSLSRAYQKNTQGMNTVIRTVKLAGIDEGDIKTSSYTIQPIYPTDDRGRRLPGKPLSFRVTQELTVKVRELDRLGRFIDSVIASGTNLFKGISFGLSNIEEVQRQAKVEAVKDAQEKAALLAEALGVRLGRVLRVDESTARPMVRNRLSFEAASVSTAPQIEAGSMEVVAGCSVVYEIVQ